MMMITGKSRQHKGKKRLNPVKNCLSGLLALCLCYAFFTPTKCNASSVQCSGLLSVSNLQFNAVVKCNCNRVEVMQHNVAPELR